MVCIFCRKKRRLLVKFNGSDYNLFQNFFKFDKTKLLQHSKMFMVIYMAQEKKVLEETVNTGNDFLLMELDV